MIAGSVLVLRPGSAPERASHPSPASQTTAGSTAARVPLVALSAATTASSTSSTAPVEAPSTAPVTQELPVLPTSTATALSTPDTTVPSSVPVPAVSTVAYAPGGADLYASVGDTSPTWAFGPQTPFTSPTTFLVTGDLGDWLEVVVPVRENNTRGFLRRDTVTLRSITRALVVNTSENTLGFYDSGVLTDSFTAVTGASDSPTPKGMFSVTDLIGTGSTSGPYGPYVIATSGRSEVYDFFNGGEPLLGIHGTNSPGLLGSSVSHGCVRVDNSVITALVTQVPLGTPVLVI